MTPTATYIAEENCLQELLPPELDPAIHDANAHPELYDEYKACVATLRKIPCDPSCKGLWADQQKVVEGKDYKLKFQFLFSKEPEKWITCDQPFYRNMDVPERPIAFPLVPVKSEDRLWQAVIHHITLYPMDTALGFLITELKQKYSLTKR